MRGHTGEEEAGARVRGTGARMRGTEEGAHRTVGACAGQCTRAQDEMVCPASTLTTEPSPQPVCELKISYLLHSQETFGGLNAPFCLWSAILMVCDLFTGFAYFFVTNVSNRVRCENVLQSSTVFCFFFS